MAQQRPRRARIAIFGGSFNPPHLGHRKICRYLLKLGYDEVWIVPCFKHAFGKRLAAFRHRLEMCRLATMDIERVRVIDVERKIGGVSRTVKTLTALRAAHPDVQFSLVVGADAAADRHKWLDFERIRRLAKVVVMARAGSAGGSGPVLSPLSSTLVRARIAAGNSIVRQSGRRVADYVARNGLYGAWR